MRAIKVYDQLMEEIQSIYRSRLQIQILLSLGEGNKTLSQLREITGSTSQAIIPKIRILEASYFVKARDYEYFLTPVGRIVESKIEDYIMTTAVIHRQKEFFSDHYLQDIPPLLLMEIGDLYESELISDTNVNIFNVYFNFLKMVAEGKHISILSPISSPAHTDAVAKRVAEGIPVELIAGKDLAEQFLQPPYREQIRELLGKTPIKIMVVKNPVRVGLTLTDKGISLGLYKKDGVTYDTTTDLFSHDPVAIAWGQRLFNHYKGMAKEISL